MLQTRFILAGVLAKVVYYEEFKEGKTMNYVFIKHSGSPSPRLSGLLIFFGNNLLIYNQQTDVAFTAVKREK